MYISNYIRETPLRVGLYNYINQLLPPGEGVILPLTPQRNLKHIKMAVLYELIETHRTSAFILLGVSVFFFARQATKSKAGPPFAGTWSTDFLSIYIYGCFKFVKFARSMLDDGYSKVSVDKVDYASTRIHIID